MVNNFFSLYNFDQYIINSNQNNTKNNISQNQNNITGIDNINIVNAHNKGQNHIQQERISPYQGTNPLKQGALPAQQNTYPSQQVALPSQPGANISQPGANNS